MPIASDKFWNKKSVGYDERTPPKGPNYAARLERAGAVLSADSRVLDVGCATGEITLDLAARCGSIVGIDTAEQMIELARGKAQQRRRVPRPPGARRVRRHAADVRRQLYRAAAYFFASV